MTRGVVALLFCAATELGASAARQTVAQEMPTGQKLVDVITELDAKVHAGYNACDLNAMGSLIAPDVELYNDGAGRIVGRETVIDMLRKGLCEGPRSQGFQFRSEPVSGSLEIFPIAGFGALEFSKSAMWEDHSDGTKKPVSIVRALTVWELRGGVWIVAMQFAYSHEPVSPK